MVRIVALLLLFVVDEAKDWVVVKFRGRWVWRVGSELFADHVTWENC